MKNLVLVLFMFFIVISSLRAQLVPSGDIYCHRGGNGKFGINTVINQLEIINLFSERRRNRLFKSNHEINTELLDLEGAILGIDKFLTQRGDINIRAFDASTSSLLNITISNYQELIEGKIKSAKAEISIYGTDIELDVSNLLQEYTSDLRCELKVD